MDDLNLTLRTYGEEPPPAESGVHADLLAACSAVLAPLAALAVARGVHYGKIDDLLKTALVDAALAAHVGVSAHRAVSRISAATGLDRREVTRRVKQTDAVKPTKRRSPATEVFTRWLSDPRLRGSDADPKRLPRRGPWPSFESLAQSVTRDVHPRTLLEELCRLGLATVNDAADTVELLRETFVPQGDELRMFGFLGANVGDHLTAAVTNVLSQAPRHLEQALFADELSTQSIEQLRPLVAKQWQVIVQNLAPGMQQLIDEDRAAGRPQDQRLRIGMYAYAAGMTSQPGRVPTPVSKP